MIQEKQEKFLTRSEMEWKRDLWQFVFSSVFQYFDEHQDGFGLGVNLYGALAAGAANDAERRYVDYIHREPLPLEDVGPVGP